MAVLSGQRHVANVAATQRVIDLHKPILLLESNPDGPDQAPIAVISSAYAGGLQREMAKDSTFKWHNDKLWNRKDAINNATGYTAGATSLAVDDGAKFTVDDVVYVPRTEERIIVTAVVTNTLTVERGAGPSVAAALVDNDPLLIYATAAEEGSLPRTARSENPAVVENYTEIFKRTWRASGTWLSSSNESTPHDWNHLVRKEFLEHWKDKELAFILGTPGKETGPEGRERRLTGGLKHFMTANNQAAGGAWTISEIGTFIRSITRHGSKSKTFFHSRVIGSVLSEHSQGKLRVIQDSEGSPTFGVSLKEWLDPNGRLALVSHPELEGSPELDGLGIAVDLKAQALGYRYLAGEGPGGGRDTHVKTEVQEAGRDERRDQIIAECGLRVALPETGGVVTGVTSAA